jgi:hypothetical protein
VPRTPSLQLSDEPVLVDESAKDVGSSDERESGSVIGTIISVTAEGHR